MEFVMFIIGLCTLIYLVKIGIDVKVEKAYNKGFDDGLEFQIYELMNSNEEVED